MHWLVSMHLVRGVLENMTRYTLICGCIHTVCRMLIPNTFQYSQSQVLMQKTGCGSTVSHAARSKKFHLLIHVIKGSPENHATCCFDVVTVVLMNILLCFCGNWQHDTVSECIDWRVCVWCMMCQKTWLDTHSSIGAFVSASSHCQCHFLYTCILYIVMWKPVFSSYRK